MSTQLYGGFAVVRTSNFATNIGVQSGEQVCACMHAGMMRIHARLFLCLHFSFKVTVTNSAQFKTEFLCRPVDVRQQSMHDITSQAAGPPVDAMRQESERLYKQMKSEISSSTRTFSSLLVGYLMLVSTFDVTSFSYPLHKFALPLVSGMIRFACCCMQV